MVKKQRSFASRSSSSSRPGLERAVSQVDPPGSTSADGPDDDAASVLFLSSSGEERVRGNIQFPCSQSSHGTPGPKSPVRRPTQYSTPARSQTGDLAGKYGVQAVSQVIPCGSNSADGQNPHRAILAWACYRRIDPLGLNQNARWKDPSSCDTGHYARLATKGSVQQSPVNRPVYSEHVPVTPGPGKPGTGPMVPGTWCPVPPTTLGKLDTVTTPDTPIKQGSPGSMVRQGESVRPVYTGQKAQLEKADRSESFVLLHVPLSYC